MKHTQLTLILLWLWWYCQEIPDSIPLCFLLPLFPPLVVCLSICLCLSVFMLCVYWSGRGLPLSLSCSRLRSSYTPVCNQLVTSPILCTCLSSVHQPALYLPQLFNNFLPDCCFSISGSLPLHLPASLSGHLASPVCICFSLILRSRQPLPPSL